ncbi:MAG: c-type cytochrome [Rudaea sp.]
MLKRVALFVLLGLVSAATTYTLRTAVAAGSPPAVSPADLALKPADFIAKVSKGQIKNPYQETQADIVAQGEHLFLSYGCNGCHGGGGGGGMCPPLTNDVWVYEGDDDTIFRLVTLGSDALQQQGYSRKGRENVVGPMPPFGQIVKSTDDLFKIFAFVRSKYSASADQKYKFGTPDELK